jgi:hypothetical protein
MGNFPNAGDMSPMKEFPLHMLSEMGRVKLYVSDANPQYLDIKKMQPDMVAEAPITETIEPILEVLADTYSPVKGMCSYQNLETYFNIFRQKTTCLCLR